MGIVDIVDGHVNELLNKNGDLSEQRLEICKNCPLYVTTTMGPICNPRLYINQENEISSISKPGFVKGCGCRLKAKTRVISAHCIIKKW